MKPKLLIGILIVLIVLNVATISSFFYTNSQMKQRDRDFPRPTAPPSAPDAPRVRRSPGVPHTQAFRLSSNERHRLKDLLREFYEDTADLRLQVRELESQAFLLMELDSVPRSELDSLLAELSSVRLEMRRLAVDKLIESKEYLTPQQQKHFFRAILESSTDRGHRMGRSGMRHRDGGHGEHR